MLGNSQQYIKRYRTPEYGGRDSLSSVTGFTQQLVLQSMTWQFMEIKLTASAEER
jgi:hypothetical protein